MFYTIYIKYFKAASLFDFFLRFNAIKLLKYATLRYLIAFIENIRFSRVRSTIENCNVFNMQHKIYMVFTQIKANASLILYSTRAFPIEEAGVEMEKKRKKKGKQIILIQNYSCIPWFLNRKMDTNALCFVHE